MTNDEADALMDPFSQKLVAALPDEYCFILVIQGPDGDEHVHTNATRGYLMQMLRGVVMHYAMKQVEDGDGGDEDGSGERGRGPGGTGTIQ